MFQIVDYKLLSASTDKTLVVWTLKTKTYLFKRQKSMSKAVPEKEEEEEEEDEEKEKEEEVKTEEHGDGEVETEFDTTISADYHYKPPRFYVPFPLKIVVNNSPECCGFASNHSDEDIHIMIN